MQFYLTLRNQSHGTNRFHVQNSSLLLMAQVDKYYCRSHLMIWKYVGDDLVTKNGPVYFCGVIFSKPLFGTRIYSNNKNEHLL